MDLAITKTDGQTTYVPGTPITYTIAVTNAGPSHAGSFSITDLVPAAITGVTETCAVTGTGTCGTNASSGNAVSFTNASLAPGAGNVLTITVSGTVSPGASGPLANTATVAAAGATDTNPANDSAIDTDSPGTSQANLGITKTGPASVLPGGTVTYTLNVTNAGPSDALDVTVSDPTPTGLAFVSNTGACTTPFPCTLAAVPVGADASDHRDLRRPARLHGAGAHRQHGDVSSAATDPDATNNSATLSTAFVRDADVEVTKSAPANVLAGETIDITVSVLSHGPNGATGVEVRDVLPPGFQFVDAVPTQGVYDPASGLWTVGAARRERVRSTRDHGHGDRARVHHEPRGEDGTERAGPEPGQRFRRQHHQRGGRGGSRDRHVGRSRGRAGRGDRDVHRAGDQPRPERGHRRHHHRDADAGPDDPRRDAVARHLRRRACGPSARSTRAPRRR